MQQQCNNVAIQYSYYLAYKVQTISLLARKHTHNARQLFKVRCNSSINNKYEKPRQHICKWLDDRNEQRTEPRLHIAEVATRQQSIIIVMYMMKRDQHGNYSE